MSPARRTKSSRQSAGGPSQATLNFGSSHSRVTKPTVARTGKEALKEKDVTTKKDPALVLQGVNDDNDVQAIASPDLAEPTTAEVAIIDQTEAEVAKPKTKEEQAAEKVSDAQLKRYWKAREDERKAPRVHQEGLSMNEKILRHFDLSSQYGPCIGIARMKRWHRAQNLNMNPPVEVLAVLLREQRKDNMRAERAHVDELMSSRFVID
ncbi:putative DNA polymerase delta subunit 4 [Xylona heveae TC161]|uniref:Putative DNA polymerase delta subunit 4 n=1 Tax=Xylona heveae (strain CBS 132557 / TC161) TaxID=1328760 RepID=A0A164ZRI2_XYLHT|nr:putative DNA polymerase delta subunit 4 [Xylona heveae TC161]KZF19419.1 putative DNA polymerase delta subunit 4 [Xylona heveae TC161]